MDYDNLEEDKAEVCSIIGISPVPKLQHLNPGKNYNCTAHELYTKEPEAIDLVAEIYQDDIRRFKQEFPY